MTKASPTRAQKRAQRKVRTPAITLAAAGGPELLATSPGPSAELSIEALGYPGVVGELHVAPVRAGAEFDVDAAFHDSTEREFEVAALLSTSWADNPSANFAFTADDGGSYFTIGTPMAVMTPWGEVRIDRNANGEAAMISMRCSAGSAGEALKRLRLASATFLDHWSFTATAPTYLSRLRAHDTKHLVQTLQFQTPFRRTAIPASNTPTFIPTRLRPVLALYREALCATSPIYRFLCLYKILEGYFRQLKPELAQILRGGGVTDAWPTECVPDHKDYAPDLKRYVGKPITVFWEEQLTPYFRDAVAHFAVDGEQPLVASAPSEIERFNHVGVAVELCARVLVEAYQAAFQAAQAKGLDLSALVERDP